MSNGIGFSLLINNCALIRCTFVCTCENAIIGRGAGSRGSMETLTRIFGVPHELLHLLALLLIGRRATRFTRTAVDIPDDLSTGQYVFVAGLPALVFGAIFVLGVYGLLNAHTFPQAALALIAVLIGGFGAAGTVGDLQLIAQRLWGE